MFSTDPYRNLNQMLHTGPENRQSFRCDTTRDHWRLVSCQTAAEEDNACPDYTDGFLIEIPIRGADAKDPAVCEMDFRRRGYRYHRVDGRTPDKVGFLFDPEQPCLRSWAAPHRQRRDIPPILQVIGGDHRGNPRGDVLALHTSGDSFMSHLYEHLDNLDVVQNGAPGVAAGAPLPNRQDGEQ